MKAIVVMNEISLIDRHLFTEHFVTQLNYALEFHVLKEQPYSPQMLHKILESNADFVFIPLSMPMFASLIAAKFVHNRRSAMRLILLSQTRDADMDAIAQLYSARISSASELSQVKDIAARDSWLDAAELDRAIEKILATAFCFKTKDMVGEQIGPGHSLASFNASAERHFRRIAREFGLNRT